MHWKFWQKKPSQNFEFWSVFEPLNDPQLDYLRPQPASKFFPEWIKSIPKELQYPKDVVPDSPFKLLAPTVKQCPVFAETLIQGYIIPLWQDYKIMINEDHSYHWQANYRDKCMIVDVHPDQQYINWLPDNERKRLATTLKFNCPWRIRTPKGWSCYQMPLYYHFMPWNVLFGSIRTDTHSEINIQVAFPRDIIGKEILIPRGTPFAWYIPYKRESLGLQKIDYDHNMTAANEYGYYSKFRDGYKTHAKIKDKKD